MPSVSVIIPTYNAALFLPEALSSVRGQTRPPTEIIVVDDGSTDNTQELKALKVPDTRYIYQENTGAAAARNRGAALAAGDYLAFLDADDLWVPGKLAWQIEVLKKSPQIDMVFGHIEHFISSELEPETASRIHCPEGAAAGYLPSTFIIRRESWIKVGELDTSWEVGEFIHWYMRAQDLGLRSHLLPQTVAKRRLHRTNQGIVKRDARMDYLRIVKDAMNRRRGNQ